MLLNRDILDALDLISPGHIHQVTMGNFGKVVRLTALASRSLASIDLPHCGDRAPWGLTANSRELREALTSKVPQMVTFGSTKTRVGLRCGREWLPLVCVPASRARALEYPSGVEVCVPRVIVEIATELADGAPRVEISAEALNGGFEGEFIASIDISVKRAQRLLRLLCRHPNQPWTLRYVGAATRMACARAEFIWG
jgi:hypothetical protein